MIIIRLVLKNWMNFQSADIPLGPRTFIMGPNGIGKSNLLDALRFLSDIARPGGGLSFALTSRGGLEKIRFAAAKKKDPVELEIHLADSISKGTIYRYSLGLTADKSKSAKVVYERIRRSGELILDWPDKNDSIDPLCPAQTYLERASSNSSGGDLREIASYLGSMRYLKFVPELFRSLDPFPPADIPGDPFGRRILQRAAELPASERDRRMRVIEDILKMAMPQMPKLRFGVSVSNEPCLEGTFDIGRPRAKHQQGQLSDGILAAFAILWSFLEEGPLLLLDKPETALNHGTIHRICLIMYMSSVIGQRKQIIMSTHSADFLKDNISPVTPQEIILLLPGSHNEGTMTLQASSYPPIVRDMKKGMCADEIILDYTHPLDAMEEFLRSIE
jgi:predicted ATPase